MKLINRSTTLPARLALLTALLAVTILTSGCSNFDQRQSYWNQQLAGQIKGATKERLTSFAAANQHELNCNGNGSSGEGAPELSECYLVDSKSKGALINHRGRLFVMMQMSGGRVVSHTFETSTVLY